MVDVNKELLYSEKVAALLVLKGTKNVGKLLVTFGSNVFFGNPKKRGKQRMIDLSKKDIDLSTFELTNEKIKEFQKMAKKYKINYSVLKDKTADKSVIVFQAKSADLITQAISEMANRASKENRSTRQSITDKIANKKQNQILRTDQVKESVQGMER